jgi:uncharacterized protein with PIN domain
MAPADAVVEDETPSGAAWFVSRFGLLRKLERDLPVCDECDDDIMRLIE